MATWRWLRALAAAGKGLALESWPVSTPEREGIDAAALEALHRDRGRQAWVHRRPAGDPARGDRGRARLPARLHAPPPRRSTSHPYNYYHPDWHPYVEGRGEHTLQSVTKSVTSLLIGIAIGRGEVPAWGLRRSPFSAIGVPRSRRPQGDDHARGPAHDAGGHRLGRDSFPTPTRETTAPRWKRARTGSSRARQADGVRPGTVWVYSSGVSQLLRRSWARPARPRTGTRSTCSGRSASQLLLEEDTDGLPDTEGGLYLEPRDLARIGRLVLEDGMWEKRRLCPRAGCALRPSPRSPTSPANGAADWGRVSVVAARGCPGPRRG